MNILDSRFFSIHFLLCSALQTCFNKARDVRLKANCDSTTTVCVSGFDSSMIHQIKMTSKFTYSENGKRRLTL